MREEIMWRQRAKQKWLKDGDANTPFFHRSTIIHRQYNTIHSLKNSFGSFVHSWFDIGTLFHSYFKDLFTSSNPSYPLDLENIIPYIVSDEDNRGLLSIPTPCEIKKTVFSMAANKTPGPDGMSPLFYKTYWDIVGIDVVKAVTHFFETGHLLKAMNHTFITLIPKSNKANKVEQFRPISLCNVSYKIISKIIAQRIKPLLDSLISPNQLAFVPGRNISDNSIITHEIMHSINSHSGKIGLMAIKIDMAKAYDRVEWPLLLDILLKFGFHQTFVNWIKTSISTTSFSTLVNGSPFGFFHPTRGIRQGDPLSPYLFLLYFDLFSRLIHRAETSSAFNGIKISRGSPSISHVMYADDLLIFGKTDEHNVDGIAEVIEGYERWSGQLVSKKKMVVHFSKKVSRQVRNLVCMQLGFRECNHKIKHLGLPFCKPATRSSDFNELIDRVDKKLAGWKAKCLAHAGRNVLVKSVAQSIPIYFMSLYYIPRSVCDSLDKKMRNFWWGDRDENRHIYLRSWDFICSPKEFGGLGLRRTRDMNSAMVSKLAWKMCEDKFLPWIQILKSKYLRGSNFMDQNETPRTSSKIWKSIMACKDSIRKGLISTISLHGCTRTWEDPWIPTIPGFIPTSDHLTDEMKAQSYLVRYFLNSDTCEWRLDRLHVVFQPDIVTEILKIRIATRVEPRRILWAPSKNGNFSVSSSYYLDHYDRFLANSRGEENFWKRFLKSKIHDRLKFFLWRVLVKALPTGNRLHSIIPQITPVCFFCHTESESEEHIFLHCPRTRSAWWNSKWDIHLEFIQFVACLMNRFWKNRNCLLHGEEMESVESLLTHVHVDAADHFQTQLSKIKTPVIVVTSPSIPTHRGKGLRVNVDAAFKEGSCCVSMMVVSEEKGLLFAASRVSSAMDAKEAELLAIFSACLWLEKAPFMSIVFESDCLGAVEEINSKGAVSSWRNESLIMDIRSFFGFKPGWCFNFISRDLNVVAHNLCQWGFCRKWDGPIPLDLLNEDILCNEVHIPLDPVPFFLNLYI
ncbi:hypothetical protein BUALT_Bualt16G0056200 [Buddleja alternifolia]|uniref:Reverse transcriptase domain-containing protein n=1 Tax=Buddleja alternifolia TaxID=168488 RepID=A0AAV6WFL9_9LAMI|nr:hypothetical protein BUALT_Bualt16G0056200 [Buddleja alternifolia]